MLTLRKLVVLSLALGGLAACNPPAATWTEAEAPKPLSVNWVQWNHVVRFPADGRLSGPERARLAAFLQEVGSDIDRIALSARDSARGEQQVREVQALFARTQRLQVGFAPDAPADAVTVTVGRYVATLPPCPNWQRPNLAGPDFNNLPSSNLGCATTTNLGLMVHDPGDLVVGRSLGPADPYTTSNAVRRYREGKDKELPKDEQAGGSTGASTN